MGGGKPMVSPSVLSDGCRGHKRCGDEYRIVQKSIDAISYQEHCWWLTFVAKGCCRCRSAESLWMRLAREVVELAGRRRAPGRAPGVVGSREVAQRRRLSRARTRDHAGHH